ncbi:MAG: hypothetical protein CMH54_04435 [Myxococcales bacterium]|nr:hypothetical protein [Myxococcales bacterium]
MRYWLRTLCIGLVVMSYHCAEVNIEESNNQNTNPSDTDASAPECPTCDEPCTTDQECWPSSVCLDGICGRECVTDEECVAQGAFCHDHRCKAANPQDTTGSVDTSTPTDTGSSPQDTGQPDTSVPDTTSSDPGTPKKGFGDPCQEGSECESSLCLDVGIAGTGFCTQACTRSKECGAGFLCAPVSATEKVCAPSDVGNPVDCAASTCFGLLSLQNGLGQCVCSGECLDASDCPASMVCSYAQTQAGNVKACIPFGAPCSGPNDCYQQACAGEPGSTGFCTATCETTLDCPGGAACAGVDGTSQTYCQ